MADDPATTGRKIRRTKLLYDMDLLSRQVIFRVDLIIEDPNSTIITPITPSLEARLTDERDSEAIPKRNFSPRQVTCTFSPDGKVVNRTVYIPYNSSADKTTHIRELRDYPKLICIEYKGETHNDELENFL